MHIDYPSDRAEYERIDSEDLATRRDFYASHDLSLPTVWRIITSDGAYLGLWPRGTLADFDKLSLTPELAKELQAKTNPISERIHQTLRTHHSEIWRLQPELTTRAENPMPRRYSMMRTDLVAPPKDGAYDTAMKDLVRELAANGVETLAFFGSYGDGAYHYIFSSEKPIKARKLTGLAETRDVAISRVEIR
ncbi:MAG TPA: hypothetical protein VII12_14870 [Thermoanaerobaculia bacterium]